MGKNMKEEVRHDFQDLGLLTWVNPDAIYQEMKDMEGGRAGTSQERRTKSSMVNVFSWRFL